MCLPSPGGEAVMATVTFQQGVSGYGGTVDTMVREPFPDTSMATNSTLAVDFGSNETKETLLLFGSIFGSGAGQIPFGATITSATLTLYVTNGSPAGGEFHRMLADWSGLSTWNSLVNGVQLDGSEAVAAADLVTGSIGTGWRTFSVTSSLVAWLSGASSAADANLADKGWVFTTTNTDGWVINSSESSRPPILTVTYTAPAGNQPPVASDDNSSTLKDQAVTINVLANDTDPDSNTLSVNTVGTPTHGTAVLQADNTILYTPESGFAGN